MLRIRKFREADETWMKRIAPRAFSVHARYSIDRTLPRDRVRRRYVLEVEGYTARKKKKDDNIEVFVAELQDRVVGYIVVGLDLPTSEIFGFKWGHIISLAVDPGYHNRGIGSRLIARGLRWLKSKGVVYAQVSTDQNNIAAIRAYEKNHFRVIYSGLTLSQYL